MRVDGHYLGIDVGSVSTNLVLTDLEGHIVRKLYIRTGGQPIKSLLEGLKEISAGQRNPAVVGAGSTGSGRELAGVIAGADIVKNEITTHAVAAQTVVPGVKTILEIGGQDSKIIILKTSAMSTFVSQSATLGE